MNDLQRLESLLLLPDPERETGEVMSDIRDIISRDFQARDLYVEWCCFESNLAFLAQGESAQGSLVASQVSAQRQRQSRRRLVLVAATLATVLVIATQMWCLQLRMSVRPLAAPPIAGFFESVGEQTWMGQRTGPGAIVRTGHRISSTQGQFLVHMDSGALVAGNSAVEMKIISSHEIFLNSGDVCIHVPPRAKGFVVTTANGRLIDQGTLFGVSARPGGSAEVHVLKGAVEAVATSGDKALVPAGRARQLSHAGALGVDEDANAAPFAPSLLAMARVRELSPTVRFLIEPPATVVGETLARSGMLLFREQQHVHLSATTDLYAAVNGRFDPAHLPPRYTSVSAPALLTAFYFHSDSTAGMYSQATITFDRPIVALALSPQQLQATDSLAGMPDTTYPDSERSPELFGNRGFVDCPQGLPENGDSFEISPDRRTLTLQMQCGPGRIDQVRIFVAEQ